jgi:uncharacterized membrane protein
MGDLLEHKRLKRVLLWRLCSIILTLIVTFLITGNLIESSYLTLVLNILLITGHYIFETLWENYHSK